jgi:hypothetical protein
MTEKHETTRWLARPITRSDVLMGVIVWTVLDAMKAVLGVGPAMALAGAAFAALLVLLWWTGDSKRQEATDA